MPMPSMMQHSIVSSRPTSSGRPGMAASSGAFVRLTMAVIILLARPVTVRQPVMMPAMPQATATEMQLRPPDSRALNRVFSLKTSALPEETSLPVAAAFLRCTRFTMNPNSMIAAMQQIAMTSQDFCRNGVD